MVFTAKPTVPLKSNGHQADFLQQCLQLSLREEAFAGRTPIVQYGIYGPAIVIDHARPKTTNAANLESILIGLPVDSKSLVVT